MLWLRIGCLGSITEQCFLNDLFKSMKYERYLMLLTVRQAGKNVKISLKLHRILHVYPMINTGRRFGIGDFSK